MHTLPSPHVPSELHEIGPASAFDPPVPDPLLPAEPPAPEISSVCFDEHPTRVQKKIPQPRLRIRIAPSAETGPVERAAGGLEEGAFADRIGAMRHDPRRKRIIPIP
jgi:hypothetical protein